MAMTSKHARLFAGLLRDRLNAIKLAPEAAEAVDALFGIIGSLRDEAENEAGQSIALQDLGAALNVYVPPGADILASIRSFVAQLDAKNRRQKLNFTPLTLRSGRIDDAFSLARGLPLYKQGDMKLIWVNEHDLITLEAAGIARRVSE